MTDVLYLLLHTALRFRLSSEKNNLESTKMHPTRPTNHGESLKKSNYPTDSVRIETRP